MLGRAASPVRLPRIRTTLGSTAGRSDSEMPIAPQPPQPCCTGLHVAERTCHSSRDQGDTRWAGGSEECSSGSYLMYSDTNCNESKLRDFPGCMGCTQQLVVLRCLCR